MMLLLIMMPLSNLSKLFSPKNLYLELNSFFTTTFLQLFGSHLSWPANLFLLTLSSYFAEVLAQTGKSDNNYESRRYNCGNPF